jgi:hypothetical protein
MALIEINADNPGGDYLVARRRRDDRNWIVLSGWPTADRARRRAADCAAASLEYEHAVLCVLELYVTTPAVCVSSPPVSEYGVRPRGGV